MGDKIDYKKIILMTVATAGILAIAVLAPNALQILRPFLKKKKNQIGKPIKRFPRRYAY